MPRPGSAGRQRAGHLPGQCQPGRGGGLDVLVHQSGQYRQRHRAGAERQRHDDGADDPVVAQPDLMRALGRAVVEPADGVHLRPGPVKQRVVDRRQHRLAGRDQQRHDQPREGQAEILAAPAGMGEEPVRPVMPPHGGQPRPGQHAAHRAPSGLGEEPAGQRAEGAERRSGEQRPEAGQQRHQRGGKRYRRVREHRRGSLSVRLLTRRCSLDHGLIYRTQDHSACLAAPQTALLALAQPPAHLARSQNCESRADSMATKNLGCPLWTILPEAAPSRRSCARCSRR